MAEHMKLKSVPDWLLKHILAPARMPLFIKPRLIKYFVWAAGWSILFLLPLYCLGMVEYIHFANKETAIAFFQNRGAVVAFDLMIMYLLWLCVLCLVQKGWIAVLLYSGIFGLVSFVNYLKHAMTGDFFYPWDLLQQAGNIGELTNFITVPFPVLYTAMILFGLLMAIPVFFSGAKLPLRWKIRYPLLAVVICAMGFSVSTPDKVTKVLNRNSLYLEDMALQTSNYYANGFVGAFTINVLSSNIQIPEGYNSAAVTELMASYEDQTASEEFSSPDIILILSESFWDPTLLPGTTFSEDPLAEYRSICQEEGVISGRFFTTGLGGGTVRPEFEVLTGLTSDYLPSGCVPWQYINEPSESYVSIYNDMGYSTMAIHPYTSSFYCRKEAYPMIGFDELHFDTDIAALNGEIEVTYDGGQITDDTFAQSIMYYMDRDDTPKFVFGISMENHQPYPGKYGVHSITVENAALDADAMDSLVNYTQGVSHADKCLAKLVEYVKNREKDTILIWFGDHLPTLGSNLGAYHQAGVNALEKDAYYEYLYSTPFVICANFELGESRILQPGTDNAVASYNLMNGVSELIGGPRTAYMEFLADYYATIPYSNVRLNKELSPEEQAYADAHRMLTYDRIAGSGFSLD